MKLIITSFIKEVKLLFEERLEELNSIEVEEIEKNGKIYLVDINNNIYSEEGEVIGTWPI